MPKSTKSTKPIKKRVTTKKHGKTTRLSASAYYNNGHTGKVGDICQVRPGELKCLRLRTRNGKQEAYWSTPSAKSLQTCGPAPWKEKCRFRQSGGGVGGMWQLVRGILDGGQMPQSKHQQQIQELPSAPQPQSGLQLQSRHIGGNYNKLQLHKQHDQINVGGKIFK